MSGRKKPVAKIVNHVLYAAQTIGHAAWHRRDAVAQVGAGACGARLRLTSDERAAYDAQGFVVRERAFDAAGRNEGRFDRERAGEGLHGILLVGA